MRPEIRRVNKPLEAKVCTNYHEHSYVHYIPITPNEANASLATKKFTVVKEEITNANCFIL